MHPSADIARCRSCSLLFRPKLRLETISVRHGLKRVAFDGWTVTLTRLWSPVARHRRVPLDEIARAGYRRNFSGGGVPEKIAAFEIHTLAGRRMHALTLVMVSERRVRGFRFQALADTINDAVDSRLRLLFEHRYGLGPWSPQEWAAIESGTPQLRELDEYTPQNGKPAPYRARLGYALEKWRAEPDAETDVWAPGRVRGLPSLVQEPIGRNSVVRLYRGVVPDRSRGGDRFRREDEIWRALIAHVAAGQDLRDDPEWKRTVTALLGWGQHWLTVTPPLHGRIR